MSGTYHLAHYAPPDKPALLALLLQLQVNYFQGNATTANLELAKEHDSEKIYSRYITSLENEGAGAFILLAKNSSFTPIGFIIGRISVDEDLVLNPTGIVEDWFVLQEWRKQGIGIALYEQLENWFREKGCLQASSETWEWNDLSIQAHRKLGFAVTGIKFGKKLYY